MVDKASGTNIPNPANSQSPTETGKVAKGEHENKSVQAHSPKGSKLDRTPSKTPTTSLKKRLVAESHQTHSIQTVNQNQIRLLALKGHWVGVASALKLQVTNEEQFHQILEELAQATEFSPEAQSAISEEFSRHKATKTAGVLMSGMPEDPIEELGTLAEILESPERHDSPIGTLTRVALREFVHRHGFEEVDLKKMVQTTTEQTFRPVADRAEQLENDLLQTTSDEVLQIQIKNTQNERKLEEQYRRELMSKG